jgi:hypothetical protein
MIKFLKYFMLKYSGVSNITAKKFKISLIKYSGSIKHRTHRNCGGFFIIL